MINRFKNQIYLHAASEVFDEFINSKKSFLECCAEFNVGNIGEMFSILIANIALNNFCQEKDTNFELTKNDDYSRDEHSAYDFSHVKILNGRKYSHKQIIKEIRDGLEHISYEIEDDHSIIHINNRRTGFIADVSMGFFFDSFFSHLDASNYNSFLLDDSRIDYTKSINENFNNARIYRLKATRKNEERNSSHFKGQSLKNQTLEFMDETKYQRIRRNLDAYQKSFLIEYYSNHRLTKDSLRFSIPAVQYDDSGFSNEQSLLFATILYEMSERLNKEDITFANLVEENPKDVEMLETLNNYLKILFITDYYKSANLVDDETTHIRNCMCHGRYTKLPVGEIVLHDHYNGINNEENSTFKKKYNIEELYQQVEKLSLEYDRKAIKSS